MKHSEMRQDLRDFCKKIGNCDFCIIKGICDRHGPIDSFREEMQTDDDIEYLYKSLAIEIKCSSSDCETCEICKARRNAGEHRLDCGFFDFSKQHLFELFDTLVDYGVLDAIDEDSFDVDRVDDSAIDILLGE